jgi:multicomponent Na+:H+ antiporter subunit G
MNLAQDIPGLVLILTGLTFMALGSVGIVRLPDFFSRAHAAGKVDTVGTVLVLIGVAIIEGFTLSGGKVLVAALFVMLTNPVAAHALARAALFQGQKPWRRGEAIRPGQKDGSDELAD